MSPAEAPWPVLVAGTITRDDVRTPAGFNADGLGGSATYCTLAARLFAPVQVVATAGPDFMPTFQAAMAGTGADLRSVALAEVPTYRWRAEHDYDTGTTRAETSEQGAYVAFEPTLTAEQRLAPIAFVGSMEPRHQLRVIEQLEHPRLIAGDTMRLYIREQPQALDAVLKRLDYLFLNAAEATALAEVDTIEVASAELRRRYRLRGLLIKEGPRGATLYREGGNLHLPAFPIDPPVDPTGAGDAVAGGFLGYLAERRREDVKTLRLALAYAMVLASFAIQRFSVAGLQWLTRAEVETRMLAMAWKTPAVP
ncbi:MAG: PfkB family carbohydrate kinase [Candidatus Dormibacteraeota bacterium]|nr:PfkB family carbohydrate kinase [Candidatus Dormibacteraeota bacterium]